MQGSPSRLPDLSTSLGPLRLSSCLLNSASPAATSVDQIRALLGQGPDAIGAVTFRTSLLNGFAHHDATHGWTQAAASPLLPPPTAAAAAAAAPVASGLGANSVNCFGYSPHPFREYLDILTSLRRAPDVRPLSSPQHILISITGSADDVATMIRMAAALPPVRTVSGAGKSVSFELVLMHCLTRACLVFGVLFRWCWRVVWHR